MSSSSTPPTPRREFIGQLTTVAVALAGTACAGAATGGAQAAPAPAPAAAPPPPPNWSDGWTAKLTGKHKAVFDAPEIADGTVITNAYVFLMGYKDVYGLTDGDLNAVLVVRHAAIPMAVDDVLWAKYDLGKMAKIKDPATKKWARRNPFWRAAPDDPASAPYTLDALHKRGAILIGCNLAANRMARGIADRTKQDRAAVMAEVKAHLVPGIEMAHSGIFAVMRAQEAGCSYVRSA